MNNILSEYFISENTCKLLMEKEFPFVSAAGYMSLPCNGYFSINKINDIEYFIPSLHMVHNWLRTFKHIDIMVVPLCIDINKGSTTNFETPDAYEARIIKNGNEYYITYHYEKYEEAYEAALVEAIKTLN